MTDWPFSAILTISLECSWNEARPGFRYRRPHCRGIQTGEELIGAIANEYSAMFRSRTEEQMTPAAQYVPDVACGKP